MLLTTDILDELSLKAQQSPRLRMNFNLHESTEDSVQRMFNAMEPGTVIPIHRHRDANETMLLLRGSMRALIYNAEGEEIENHIIEANSTNFGIHISKGQWHSVEVLQTGTVMLEVKEGPYAPLSNDDILTR